MNGSDIDEEGLRRFFNEGNPEDALFAEKIFTDDTRESELKKILEEQFNEMKDEDDQHMKNLDHIFYRIYYNITSKNAAKKSVNLNTFMKWTYRIAGIIFIPLTIYLGIQLHQANSAKNNYVVEIKAPAWTRAQFSLPDGTTGWLNSNSTISYKGNFINKRTVSLNGEAFFNVAKNPRKPFVVQTREVDVKVLGTKFNIASYLNENNVEVVLEEGKLVFTDKANDRSYTMKPNDLVVYSKKEKKYAITRVLSAKYTSWKEGKLVFRNDPVDVVVRRLERWYNVVIVNNVPASEDLRWRATFQDEDIEKVLDLMKRTLPIDYHIESPAVDTHDTYVKKKITITLKHND
ncbi:MAG TPA: FecR domain-containing protein [Bacteroidales bacterium]|nr:FecR domain-containing protein [Bacteroidales bacterium]